LSCFGNGIKEEFAYLELPDHRKFCCPVCFPKSSMLENYHEVFIYLATDVSLVHSTSNTQCPTPGPYSLTRNFSATWIIQPDPKSSVKLKVTSWECQSHYPCNSHEHESTPPGRSKYWLQFPMNPDCSVTIPN
jgi:hypothetical protein